jgi:hypothetical protein
MNASIQLVESDAMTLALRGRLRSGGLLYLPTRRLQRAKCWTWIVALEAIGVLRSVLNLRELVSDRKMLVNTAMLETVFV